MKLGIINDWSREGFAYAKRKGLSFLEFCVNYNYNVDDFVAKLPEIKKLSLEFGVSVGSIGRWGADRIKKDGTADEKEFKDNLKLIEACAFLGCPVFVCGCNYTNEKSFEENCNIAIKLFTQFTEYGEKNGVKIAVYNCDWCNFVFGQETWEVIMPKVPLLGIKYDTSHCIARGNDYIKESKYWGNRFYHVHIKGTMIIEGGLYDNPPAGLDQTNWGAFLNMLYTKNYDGGLSIEPHSGYWQGIKGQWGVDFTIKYISQYIMPENYNENSNSPYMP
ncbi:MAG: hypothetical protein K0S55_993 [Clostridia bacterium]|nr:hypothetical protein [Clostridia bacterium]